MALPAVGIWTGDFDAMLKRRVVRILVPFSRTSFFLDKGVVLGVEAELGRAYEKSLNRRFAKKNFAFQVVFIPTPRDRLLTDLVAGKGDIAAGTLTVTPERQSTVDFALPWATGVKEVLVTGPSSPSVGSIDDLGARPVMVRFSSSYYTHLLALNEARTANGFPPIDVQPVDDNLEDEDLLEMVNTGMLPWAIVDRFKARAWASILTKLTVRDDIAVNEGGKIAWAIRKNSPLLQKELASFVAGHRIGTAFGNDIRLRYSATGKTIKNALASTDADKLNALMVYFNKFGADFAIDPLLLAAQGYQESSLDQTLRNRSGAVGVMQIKPSTAREKEINIEDVAGSASNNINAAAKYLRFLADKYITDPGVDARDRVLMALAAYNAGPGNLKKFRAYASAHGFKSNVWFGNVENGAAAIIGLETVQYIGNIYKYYVAYSILKNRK